LKILIINTYHHIRGGDSFHALNLGALLENSGHTVHYFAMQGKNNLPCPDERYFVGEIDYRQALKSSLTNGYRVLWRSLYSTEAKKSIAKQLDEVKPDIAHLHSIRHHLTKSILPEIAQRNIPIVWTLHDYKELCPNTSFYDGTRICEACKGKRYYSLIKKRCKKGSLLPSLVTYLEAHINDCLGYDEFISLYISPSLFLRNKFIEYGYDSHKIRSFPNFLRLNDFVPDPAHEDYLLYVGRLEQEKGLKTLIEGFTRAAQANPHLRLKIAGNGSMEEELKSQLSIGNATSVEMVGFRQGQELRDLLQKAKAVIVPSEWYENYPFASLEAMACGKPVIASRIGGIPEQVEDEVTGFLFEPFNPASLSEKIEMLQGLSEKEIALMGQRAREAVEKHNAPDVYLDFILQVYNDLLQKGKANGPKELSSWNAQSSRPTGAMPDVKCVTPGNTRAKPPKNLIR
jgi:glycosyltransferase involved in cell wall biosynthesis